MYVGTKLVCTYRYVSKEAWIQAEVLKRNYWRETLKESQIDPFVDILRSTMKNPCCAMVKKGHEMISLGVIQLENEKINTILKYEFKKKSK